MISKPVVLICDDDSEILQTLHLGLKNHFEIKTANTILKAKELTKTVKFDIAIVDLNFEGQDLDGLHLLDFMSTHFPSTYLVVLSGDISTQRVVQAMRRRLFDFITKGTNYIEQLFIVLNNIKKIYLPKNQSTNTNAIYQTESIAVKDLLQTIDLILKRNVDSPILILGETGTGKEFLAKHIAQNCNLNLVPANMSCIQKETAESVLFGHTRGAFTGANSDTTGLIESAHGGIFFLDEIGECSPSVQAKLLRAIQEKEISPLGSTKTKKINVRFIAATHCNLEKMVNDGLFRQDLLQRLNTFILRLPPLRERKEDIHFYANLFLENINQTIKNLDNNYNSQYALTKSFSNTFKITHDGEQALLNYSWPGNIRELKNVIDRIGVLSTKFDIDHEVVTTAIINGRNNIDINSNVNANINPNINFSFSSSPSFEYININKEQVCSITSNIRKNDLINALNTCEGNKRHAALLLKISEATLYRWIKEFKISEITSFGSIISNKGNNV